MNAFDIKHNQVIIPSQADSRISSYTVYIVPTCSAIVITRVFLSGTEKYLTNTAASTLTDDAKHSSSEHDINRVDDFKTDTYAGEFRHKLEVYTIKYNSSSKGWK